MYIMISMMIALSILICIIVGVVAFKMFVKKENPTNFFTPFDYISGQEHNEFHEERKEDEQEEEEDAGDDKDK